MKKLSLVFGHLKENEVDETFNYANLILEVEVLVLEVERGEVGCQNRGKFYVRCVLEYVMSYARVNGLKKGGNLN